MLGLVLRGDGGSSRERRVRLIYVHAAGKKIWATTDGLQSIGNVSAADLALYTLELHITPIIIC